MLRRAHLGSGRREANLHVELLYGRDGHHIAEAIFKGLGRALREACEIDPRVKGIPSTKDAL